eukprot:1649251-Amphidinium_carterae.1
MPACPWIPHASATEVPQRRRRAALDLVQKIASTMKALHCMAHDVLSCQLSRENEKKPLWK